MRYIKIVMIVLGCLSFTQQAFAATDATIWQWAPVIYQQDVREDPMARENIFTLLNYDHDWRLNNNAGNLPFYPPELAVYYSVVETSTHYFLGYYFYYPRHIGNPSHDHDISGILTVIRKDGSSQGILELLLSYHHNQWRKWEPSRVQLMKGHPVFMITSGTHEIGQANATVLQAGSIQPRPLGDTSVSSLGIQSGYRLVSMQELWQHRNDIGQGHTFNRWGFFDSYYYLGVSAPWMWEYRGTNWLSRPAELVQAFMGSKPQPVTYSDNPYQQK